MLMPSIQKRAKLHKYIVFHARFFACFLAVQKTSHKLVNFLFFSYLCILYQSSKQKNKQKTQAKHGKETNSFY